MSKLVLRSSIIDLGGYSLGSSARGYAFTCPHCGEQWGKLEMDGVGLCWIVASHPCENHGGNLGLGGSVLHRVRWGNYTNPDTWKNVEKLPDGLLRHECLMLAQQILGEKP
jgi:hypothetical protein